MSKQRIINTRFWIDDYTSNLDPIEKLLFLYFLTSTATEICGVYEIPLKTIAVETGIEAKTVEEILKRFTRDKKIFYIDGWVYIVNFTKHQTKNPSVELGIKRCLGEVPEGIMQKAEKILQRGNSLSTVSPQRGTPNLTKLNLTKPNLSGHTPYKESHQFFTNTELQEKAVSFLIGKNVEEKSARAEIFKFISYWTELNKSGAKQRWELERTFDVKRRLANWFNNVSKFSGSKSKYQVKL